jgi:hypothetical protein
MSILGDDTEKQEEIVTGTPRAFSDMAGEQLGITGRQVRRDLKLAKNFTPEQIKALGILNLPIVDVERLAKLTQPQRRDAIALLQMGNTIDEAITKATDGSPETLDAQKKQNEGDLSAKEWLELYCGTIRNKIEDRAIFDRHAILYRKTREHLAACTAKIKRNTDEYHFEAPGDFTWLLMRLIYLAHPGLWSPCGACLGLNKEKPDCVECKGAGFKLTFDWPKPKKR